jgi:membrane-bound lytic murein transglycosylase A
MSLKTQAVGPRRWSWWMVVGIVGSLVACGSPPPDTTRAAGGLEGAQPVGSWMREKSQWQAAPWAELPGWGQDALHEAWGAWLRSCEKPAPVIGALCAEVRQLSIASDDDKVQWLEQRFVPYRISERDGRLPQGLMTGYYEPMMQASRVPTETHRTPLYRTPLGWRAGEVGPTRAQLDNDPQAQRSLQGRALVWLQDPIDALIVQIQGSGRFVVTEPDGSLRSVRLAFAGHNGQTYQSIGRWLLDQRLLRDVSWDGIKAWAGANPHRLTEMLHVNPRVVFFQEEPLSAMDAMFGPRGAQGVPLTPWRSIAVDRGSIPYGTPVWLSTQGPGLKVNKLVMAQDTGGAIVGAARVDYFTGWGGWSDPAYTVAAQLKQPVRLWALWPR